MNFTLARKKAFRGLFNLSGALWRSARSVSGMCVDDEFLSHAKDLQKRFRAMPARFDVPVYICRQCKTESQIVRCQRPIFARTVDGEPRGTVSWTVPVCPKCDIENPSIDLTSPLIVMDGFRREGWRRLRSSISRFLHVEMQQAKQ